MRTTIDLEEKLLEQAKLRAAEGQTTLSKLVAEALRGHLARRKSRSMEPFRSITFGSTGGRSPPTPQEIDRITLEDELATLRKRKGHS